MSRFGRLMMMLSLSFHFSNPLFKSTSPSSVISLSLSTHKAKCLHLKGVSASNLFLSGLVCLQQRFICFFLLFFFFFSVIAQNKGKDMFQQQLGRTSSVRGCLKALESDIHHANTLADAVQRVYGGACLQMRLSYSPMAPIFLYLMQWLDCGCTYTLPSYLGLLHILVYKVYVDGMTSISTHERRASLREFYAVIYPSLQQLENNSMEKKDAKERGRCKDIIGRKRLEEARKFIDKDFDREDECGICMEICAKMVLPNCNHAMCINCYRDWNTRSQSCPFCRGSLKRVRSRDLWVLTSTNEVVDAVTLEKENVRRLYRYIDTLPLRVPDTLFLVYYDYLV